MTFILLSFSTTPQSVVSEILRIDSKTMSINNTLSFLFLSSQRETYTHTDLTPPFASNLPGVPSVSLVGSRNSPHHNSPPPSLIPHSNPPTEPYLKTLPMLRSPFPPSLTLPSFSYMQRENLSHHVRHLFMGDLAQRTLLSIILALLYSTQSDVTYIQPSSFLEM